MTTNEASPLSQILTPETVQTILSTVTDRLADSAIAVRKNALNTYSCCAVNAVIRSSMKESQADDMKALAQAIAESIAEKQ